MIPPPSAVIMPRVMTPTMSSRATRSAVRAPLSAKANDPARSRASRTGVSLLTLSFYQGRRRRESRPSDSSLAERQHA